MLRSALLVSLISLAVGIVSFVNQVILARTLGASLGMDAYLLGISLPSTVTGLLTGMLSYVVVPALQKAEAETGTSEGLLRALSLGLSSGTVLLSVVGFVGTNPLLAWVSQQNPGALSAGAANVSRVAWLWMPFAVSGAVYTAGLHIRQRFLAATLCQSFPILGTMLGCLLLYPKFGTMGLIVGQFTGYTILWLVVRCAIGSQTGSIDWRRFKRIWSRLPSALTALVIFVFPPFSDSFWGSRLGPSAISYLGYGQRFTIGVASLAMVGATTVLFPRFARQAAEGAGADLRKGIARTIRMVLIVTVPLAIILASMTLPLTRMMFQRGAFTLGDSHALAELLRPMIFAMIPVCCAGILFKALFANDDIHGAAVLSAISATTYFVLSGVLSRFLGVTGIGTAYAASFWLLVGLSLHRIFQPELKIGTGNKHGHFTLMLVLNSGILSAVVWAANLLFSIRIKVEPSHSAICMGVTALIALVTYLVTSSRLFVIPEIMELTAALARLRPAKA